MSVRLSLAIETGGFVVPAEGRIVVFHAREGHDLSALPKDRVVVVQPLRPEVETLEARGYTCVPNLSEVGEFCAAVVFLPRARALIRLSIAQADLATKGPVLVDGGKTDGIDSILKEMRKRTEVTAPLSKAHGKIFSFAGQSGTTSDWHVGDTELPSGFVTAPGVFSADAIDPASQILGDALPEKLGRDVADLGAGWGYLSSRVLERPTVENVHLVEADYAALSCAKKNIDDKRAVFHWADARTWRPKTQVNTVVMNPPFHSGRQADPALGKAFIQAAAAMLHASGALVMVANRHLPYEATLAEVFAHVEEIAGDSRFKVLQAVRPKRQRR